MSARSFHRRKPDSLCLEKTFDDGPTQANFDVPSGSDNPESDPPSTYDCDSEGGESWSDIDSKDGDDRTKGTHQPGMMGLKFQLDAARAGELHHILMDPPPTELHSSDFHQ